MGIIVELLQGAGELAIDTLSKTGGTKNPTLTSSTSPNSKYMGVPLGPLSIHMYGIKKSIKRASCIILF